MVFNFTLVTDHNPLTSLKSNKDVGGRLARWTLFLQQFNITVRLGQELAMLMLMDCHESVGMPKQSIPFSIP